MTNTDTNEVQFRSDMDVELVKHSASDADVIFAAKVSTLGKRSLDAAGTDSAEAVSGFIRYLMRNRHGSPFEHSVFTWYVSAPIMVFREFQRHRIASYNEASGRYSQLKPVFYVPGENRNLVQTGKPGHYTFVPGTPEQHTLVTDTVKQQCAGAYAAYTDMLANGVAKEIARSVLPVTIYSSMYVTMNSRALMNFLSLRTTDPDSLFPSFPQAEIEMVARQMEVAFAELMPATYAAFNDARRVAP